MLWNTFSNRWCQFDQKHEVVEFSEGRCEVGDQVRLASKSVELGQGSKRQTNAVDEEVWLLSTTTTTTTTKNKQAYHFAYPWFHEVQSFFVVFFKVFGGHMSFFGATGTTVLDFWWRLLWVSKPEWVLPYSLFCGGECNVHSPRSTYGATHASWQPVRSLSLPHMHVQRWDLARIGTGNNLDRRRMPYHCSSDPALEVQSYKEWHLLPIIVPKSSEFRFQTARFSRKSFLYGTS